MADSPPTTTAKALILKLWKIGAWLAWPAIVLSACLAFILLVVRPFPSRDDSAKSLDVASQWNTSVARLGILPIYPPEEDFYVGDVWAVIADTQDTPLLGSSVRIGHISVRDALRHNNEALPIFPDTDKMEQGAEYMHQVDSEIQLSNPAPGITLQITGFPGVVISQADSATGSSIWGLGSFSGSSNEKLSDSLRIPVAETYGIPTTDGIILLDQWCRDSKTAIYCTDAFARKVLAFSVSDRVLASSNGQYSSRIQLRLVTRVFYTREIETDRTYTSDRGYAARTNSSKQSRAMTKSNNAQVFTGSPEDKQAASQSNDNSTQDSSKIGAEQAGSQETSIHSIFQKPVAFGYRAVTIALQPAPPSRQSTP